MKTVERWIAVEAGGRIRIAPALRDRLIGLAVVYAVFLAVFDTPLWQGGRLLSPSDNLNVAEGRAWLRGSAAVAERQMDAAPYAGRLYNVFPPMMSFVSTIVLPWSPAGFPYTLLAWIIVWPVPGLAYLLFLKRCDRVGPAVVLALAFVLGTSAYPIMERSLQGGNVCRVNNAVSQLGLLIFLIDYYGARRFWVGGVGLMICGWSRWTMIAYAVPFLWGQVNRRGAVRPVARGRLAGGIAAALVVVACPLVLNTLKFGNPLDTGYGRIYDGRNDRLAMRVHETGMFSPRYVAENLYSMNLGFPRIEADRRGWRWIPDTGCTGLWWTSPILLYVFVDGRRIWRARENRWLLVSVGIVFAALMLYHNNGWTQRGYNRFSLDFLLALLVMIAPFAVESRRRTWATVVLALWSVAYFRWILY